MVGIFMEMSKKVGIFMIISQTLMHLGIGKKYEKYIRLVISLMVAAQIIFSFTSFFRIEKDTLFHFRGEDFQKEWKKDMETFDDNMQRIQEEISEKMKLNIEEEGSTAGMKEDGKIQIRRIKIE